MPDLPTDDHVCSIRSTTDPRDGTAACLMQWGTITALLTPEATLTTARDLMTAATHAETDIALVKVFRTDMKADMDTVGFVLREVRAGRPPLPGKAALRISAIAGAKTGKPVVHIARGSMKGELPPGEARQMAQHWTEVAVAAQIDVRLRYALGEWSHLTPTDIEHLFDTMRKVQR